MKHWSDFLKNHYRWLLTYSRISYKWSHTVCTLLPWPLLPSVMFLKFIMLLCLLVICSFLLLSANSLSKYTFFYSPVDRCLGYFQFGLLLTVIYKSFYGHTFSFLGKYQKNYNCCYVLPVFTCCWIWFANVLLRIFLSIFIGLREVTLTISQRA